MRSILDVAFLAAGVIMSIVALRWLSRDYRESRRPASLYLAAATGAHALRTLIHSPAAGETIAGLHLLPDGFAAGAAAKLSFMFLVSASAFFLWKTFDAFRPYRRGRIVIWAFWAIFAVEAAIMARVAIGSSDAFGSYALRAPVYAAPFLLAKVFAAGSGAAFIAGLRRPEYRDAIGLGAAAACFVSAQFVDSAFHFLDPTAPAGTLLNQALFLGGTFLTIAAMRREGAGGGSGPEEADTIASLASSAGFNEQELRIFESVANGASNKDIAYREKLSLSATKRRVQSIYGKLGVSTRFELMARLRSGRGVGRSPRAAPPSP